MIKANNCMPFSIFHISHTPILIFMFSFFFHILFIYVLPKQGNSFYVYLSDRCTAGHHEARCYAFYLQSASAIWDYFLS